MKEKPECHLGPLLRSASAHRRRAKLHRLSSGCWTYFTPYAVDLACPELIFQPDTMPRPACSTQLCISDEDYVAIDAFCGVGCFGRALVDIMAERVRKAYILSLDNRAEANLRAQHPELGKYIDEGSILFFQMDLYQLEERTLPTLLRSLLGIPMSRVNWFHCSIDCTSFSWASLSNTGHRTVEGAALSVKAISADRMLALMFNVADWLIRENDQILITFESPEHGSFKSNHQVQQRLLGWGWWLSKVDYCAVSDIQLDGAVYEEGEGLGGGVWPKKTTIILHFGLGDLGCELNILPRCL